MSTKPTNLQPDNVTRFDAAAKQWEDKPQRVLLARKVAEAIARVIPLTSDMQAVEYGCGTGMVARALSPQLKKILAVDTSPQMLEVLRQKAREEKISNIETLSHDLSISPLPANGFDLAMCSMTLHHIPDTESVLHRLFAILRPGGFLAVADLVTEDGTFHEDNTGVAHHGINPETVRAILAKNGAQDINVQEIHAIKKQQGPERKSRAYPIFLAWCKKGDNACP